MASHASAIGPSYVGAQCLRGLGSLAPCTRCAEACPVGAILALDREIGISDACIGCGRCAGACPTAALRANGPPLTDQLARLPKGRPLQVECERVPAGIRGPDALVSACLGALDATDWIAIATHAGGARLSAVDRGWCDTCPAGGHRDVPGEAARRDARGWLGACGRSAQGPSVLHDPRDPQRRDDRAPAARARRAFLRRLVPLSPAPASPDERPMARRRNELLAGIARLGGAVRESGPAAFLPALTVGAACNDNRLCASACPTGAIVAHRQGDGGQAAGLSFDASLCIACGACGAICPERAIALAPAGGTAGTVRLTTRTAAICERCDADFDAGAGESLCPRCRKDVGLFASR